jgi:DNA-binding helix-hairpin-helix protein with protein kinase domain
MISRGSRTFFVCLTLAAVIALAIGTNGKGTGMAGLLLWVVVPRLGRGGRERAERAIRERTLIGRRQKLRLLEGRWGRECGREIFDEWKETLRRRRAEYEGLEAVQAREIEQQARRHQERRLEAYLEEHPVASAPVELPLHMQGGLSRDGVATAADISPRKLDGVWELNPEVRLELLVWRRRLQDAYVPDPEVFIPEADLRTVHERFRRRRQELETELLRGPAELRRAKAEAVAAREEMAAELLEAQRQVAQARADLRKA